MARKKKETNYEIETKKVNEIAIYNGLLARLRRADEYIRTRVELQIELQEKEIKKINEIATLIEYQKDTLEVVGVKASDEELISGINLDYHISKDFNVKYFIEYKKPKDNQMTMKTK